MFLWNFGDACNFGIVPLQSSTRCYVLMRFYFLVFSGRTVELAINFDVSVVFLYSLMAKEKEVFHESLTLDAVISIIIVFKQ